MIENDDDLEPDFERINVLYANAATGYLGMAVATLIMGFFIQRLSSPGAAALWIAAVFVAYTPRLVLSVLFKRKLDRREITRCNIKPWERYFVLHSIIPYACFATAIFIPYGDNELIAVLIFAVVNVALLAGGVMTHSTSSSAILLFLNATVLPLVVKCFLIDDQIAVVMGIFLAISYGFQIKLIPKQNRMLTENIALKMENQYKSLIDPLTNLWNRRRLYLHIDNLIPTSRRSGEPFSILMLDIDRFKDYNDTHGHTAGDELLIKVSQSLVECSRDEDLVVRYGGEEFLLVLPATATAEARVFAERLRTAIKARSDVTVSIGLATYANGMTFDHLVQLADKALYVAKAGGRDRCETASDDSPHIAQAQ